MRAKILEVDAWLRTRPTVDVLEVHPECPSRPDGCADASGARPRTAAGPASTPWLRRASPPLGAPGQGYAADDVLDACAVAWSAPAARRVARWLPDPPEVFSDGIRAAIWA